MSLKLLINVRCGMISNCDAANFLQKIHEICDVLYAITAQGFSTRRGAKDFKIYVTPKAVVPGYGHRGQSKKVSVSMRRSSIFYKAGFT